MPAGPRRQLLNDFADPLVSQHPSATAPPVAVSLGFTGVASTQTAFHADVKATQPLPAEPCPNGAFYCGTANIAGYGAASWSIFFTSVGADGLTYTTTSVFTVASDGSTLVVNEDGHFSGPGKDGAGYYSGGLNSFGRPDGQHSTWTVDTADSTGQFAGLGGSGTADLQAAGAHEAGSYTGTLGLSAPDRT